MLNEEGRLATYTGVWRHAHVRLVHMWEPSEVISDSTVCVCALELVLGDDNRLLMCSVILLCYNFLTTPAHGALCKLWCVCEFCVEWDFQVPQCG